MSWWRISKPVLHNWEVFDKIYLSKKQLYDKFGYCSEYVNKLVDKWDILRFEIRDREVFIVPNEFLKYLANR